MNQIPKGIIPAPDLPDVDKFDDVPDSLLILDKKSGGEFYDFIMTANRVIIEEIGSIFPRDTTAAAIVAWVGGSPFLEESTIVYTEDEAILFATLPDNVMRDIERIQDDPFLMEDMIAKREERLQREKDMEALRKKRRRNA